VLPISFQKLPNQLLSKEDKHRLFELVATNIREQVEQPLYQRNLDRLAAVPREAQAIYWLWLFQCEASLNGIEDFILQSLGKYSPQIHEALTMVGALELGRRLEAAVPLAREWAAEFTTLSDQSWFNQFAPMPEFPTLQSVDRPTPQSGEKDVYTIIESLDELVGAFIRSHEQVLFVV
jgi:hypothetical protein